MRPVAAAGSRIESLTAEPLDVAMKEPFEIAGGSTTRVRNVLVKVRLRGGAVGYGEGAPLSAFNHDTQAATLAALRRSAAKLVGEDCDRLRPLLARVEELLGPERGAARAALGMALADAWGRRHRLPLRLLFGGAQDQVRSDVTVTIVPARAARAAARRIVALGVDTIKIKIGRDVEEDEARVRAVASARRGLRLLLDANQGYGPRQALQLLRRLRRAGIAPALFEQPAAKDDWRGLSDVHRFGRVPVAADESVANRQDALRMAAKRCAQVVNVKLMKCGLLEAWDIALICRASGLGLMAGGMIETSLAMGCAAHLAAGIGGFDFIDLDTPLWLARDPMTGVRFGAGGCYELRKAKAGIGVRPGAPPRGAVASNDTE
ncbi:MAG: dipeptide epimerase [Elusimicrobia bacterium]|nr:dipeptide epimerase [Elusimicrobiota bacterium]MDE2425139.1 dipeptide epimerase [Elusimicrobiota bacterium]